MRSVICASKMEYRPADIRSAADIASALRAVADLREILAALGSAGFSAFLYGGAVRDLLLYGDAKGDYDLATAPKDPQNPIDAAQFESAIAACGQRLGYVAKAYKGHHIALAHPTSGISFDVIYPVREVFETLARSALTIDGIAFDCGAEKFFDPLGGIEDLKQGKLRIHSPEYAIANPPHFPRIFRTACKLGLQIEGPVAELLQRYAPCISMHDGRTNMPTMWQLLKFLSLPRINGYLKIFSEFRLPIFLMPELAPLEWHSSGNESSFLRNARNAENLDAGVFPAAWEPFLNSAAFPGALERGYLRLALLFDGLGKAYAALGPGSPFSKALTGGDELVRSPRMLQNLIAHFASRYRDIPELSRALREIGPLLEASDRFLGSEEEMAKALHSSADPRAAGMAHRALVLSAIRGGKAFKLPAPTSF